MRLFGFEFKRVEPQYLKDEPIKNDSISIIDRDSESTAAIVASTTTSTGVFIDVQGTVKTESELITKYRDMMSQPEVDNAVDEIVNEAITTEDDFIVKIDLSNLDFLDDKIKEILESKHKEILNMLDFDAKAYHIFRRWYIDGRLYYHVVVDVKHLEEGIKELRYVDPRKLREIKEVVQKKIAGGTVANQIHEVSITKNNYYLYNEKGFSAIARGQLGITGVASAGIRVSKDSIVHVPSGTTDTNNTLGLSYMHKAMRILTQLKTIEDSLIIYRLARAPERRVWKIDVGNMPAIKADQYVKNVMTMQKNKLIYDSDTGTIQDSRKFMTMLEDYWLPRRADGSGTDVDILQGGQNLGNMEDVLYFQKLLYNSLNVPIERLQTDGPFSIGNTQEISRSEIKFNKFIKRLQREFSNLFRYTLKKQCILQGLMSLEEFESIEKLIRYEFAQDNHFAELKDQLIMKSRTEAYMGLQQTGLIGMYYSNQWVRRNIFQQNDDDIQKMTMEIIGELQNPLYNRPPPGSEDPNATDPENQPDQEQPQQEEPQPNEVDKGKVIVSAISAIPDDKRSSGDSKKLRKVASDIQKDNKDSKQ